MYTEEELKLIMFSLSMEIERGVAQRDYCNQNIREIKEGKKLIGGGLEIWESVCKEIEEKLEKLENLYNKVQEESLKE